MIGDFSDELDLVADKMRTRAQKSADLFENIINDNSFGSCEEDHNRNQILVVEPFEFTSGALSDYENNR